MASRPAGTRVDEAGGKGAPPGASQADVDADKEVAGEEELEALVKVRTSAPATVGRQANYKSAPKFAVQKMVNRAGGAKRCRAPVIAPHDVGKKPRESEPGRTSAIRRTAGRSASKSTRQCFSRGASRGAEQDPSRRRKGILHRRDRRWRQVGWLTTAQTSQGSPNCLRKQSG